MEGNDIKAKEKNNKRIALIVMIASCALCFIFGVVGGVAKFISFVNETSSVTEENMRTEEEKEFNDGVLNIKSGGSVVGTYKCSHSSCGYVYGYTDDALYDLRAVDVSQDYQIRKIINNRFVLLFDDDAEDETLHRDGGVKVYDFTTSKVVKEYQAIKNYNKNELQTFIAKDENGKWGVIRFNGDKIVDMVSFDYDYIGIFVPTGEKIDSQNFFAARKGEDWVIIDVKNNSVYSKEFNSPIVAYDGEMLIVKKDQSFEAYDFKGNLVFENATDYSFAGAGLLVVNDVYNIKVFDSYAVRTMFENSYVAINSVSSNEENGKIIVKVNDDEVYVKNDLKKSERNLAGADYSMIINK